MSNNRDTLIQMAKYLQEQNDVSAHILPGYEIGFTNYAVCRAASSLLEEDHGKAALAALRAGFVPVPVCPRFEKPTVDLDVWRFEISIRSVRDHWKHNPQDEVGFLLQPTESTPDYRGYLI